VADTAAVVVLEDTFKVDQSIIRRREIMGGRDSVVVERLGCRIVGCFRPFRLVGNQGLFNLISSCFL
jgi:hypothetical protein